MERKLYTSHLSEKITQFGGPAQRRGAPCHGTIGTMVNPALGIPTVVLSLTLTLTLHGPTLTLITSPLALLNAYAPNTSVIRLAHLV